jgi:hypothetical protein
MRLKKKITIIAGLLFVDVVVAILIFEVSLRLVGYNFGSKYNGPIAFLKGEQTIFQSHGSAFTYLPHMLARSEHVYYSDSDFKVAFDYTFSTNNLGLVQDNDVFPGGKSVLVLGDSYTEGVGSPPWFTTLAPEIEKFGYQPINGGLRGTGFHMWWQLAQYLEREGLQIDKLVIVFTSGDFSAQPMTFPEDYLRCLTRPVLHDCDVEKFYFLPLPSREQLPLWVDAVRTKRNVAPISAPRTKLRLITDGLEALVPGTYHVYKFLQSKVVAPQPLTEDELNNESLSRAALQAIVKKYGLKNIVFVHVPVKNEPTPSLVGLRARQAISSVGGLLVDGFKLCGLSISDYYPIDPHPTESGYNKVSACVAQAFNQLVTN